MAEENEDAGSEPAKEAPKAPDAPKGGGLVFIIIIMIILLGGFGGAFTYLDGRVKISEKKLDRVWEGKQQDLRSMARQRMYDTSQSHLQTEMMDRWRNTKTTKP